MMRGGDLIVEYLIREKVPYLFGVCGHGNIGFLDAALAAQDRIKSVMVHHEQTAGFMAEAFYKVSHQLVATPIRPKRLVKALSNVLPEDAIVAADVGSHPNWLVELLSVRSPRHFLQSWGFGSMGFATSGILGAKLATPERP